MALQGRIRRRSDTTEFSVHYEVDVAMVRRLQGHAEALADSDCEEHGVTREGTCVLADRMSLFLDHDHRPGQRDGYAMPDLDTIVLAQPDYRRGSFTVGHETGEVRLERLAGKDPFVESLRGDLKEMWCNRYGAAVLMRRGPFMADVEVLGPVHGFDPERLQPRWPRASREAIARRLAELYPARCAMAALTLTGLEYHEVGAEGRWADDLDYLVQEVSADALVAGCRVERQEGPVRLLGICVGEERSIVVCTRR